MDRDLSYSVSYCATRNGGHSVEFDTGESDWSEVEPGTNVFGLVMTGPFAARGQIGYRGGAHSSHGVPSGSDDISGVGVTRPWVFSQCLEAIRRADIFFAWLDYDSLTAYGTMVEVGIARALGKPIYLGVPARLRDGYGDEGDEYGGVNPWPIDFDYEGEPSWHAAATSSEMWDQHFHSPALDEMWFAAQCATNIVYDDGPVGAVRRVAESVLSDRRVQSQGSRAQSLFWDECKRGGHPLAGPVDITTQYVVLDGHDPVDFACPESMVAIDIEEAPSAPLDAGTVARSRRRQVDIESAGWRLLRLSAADVIARTDECLDQVVALIDNNGTHPDTSGRHFDRDGDAAPFDLLDEDDDIFF